MAVKKILPEKQKKKRELSNKVYNFFPSNLCRMFDLSNKGKIFEQVMGIVKHRVNFHRKILSLKKKSSS